MVKVTLDYQGIEQVTQSGLDFLQDKVAPAVAEEARKLAPKASGQLANSINTFKNDQGSIVVAEAPYALFVELGTSKSAAQPYLRPAVDVVAARNQ